MNKSLVSVVTICYNDLENLKYTFSNVQNQTYQPLEYIIVDGASNDGTKDFLQDNDASITKWISEADKGLYDAMNKGLAMATGDYVWFINAGDEIFAPDTLNKVMDKQPEADVYFGDTLITDLNREAIGDRRLKPPKHVTWKTLKDGMLISHQAFIARRDIAPRYDLRYRYSADFDWMIRALKAAKQARHTGLYLARFLDGGRTKKTIVPGLKERFRIMTRHYGLFPTCFRHIPIGIRFFYFWARNKRF